MRHSFFSIFLSLASFEAFSASIERVQFDTSSRDITIDVVYGGGCKEHKFDVKPVSGCLESRPAICKLELVETVVDGPDLCEAVVARTLVFNADDLGIVGAYYDEALITVVSSDGSKGSFLNTKRYDQEIVNPSVLCPAGNGRFIKFIPEYGEIHYLNADGSEWQSHDDGLSIDILILESNPPQIEATITDDEGNVLGGWRFTDGQRTFKANYLAKSYSGCREV